MSWMNNEDVEGVEYFSMKNSNILLNNYNWHKCEEDCLPIFNSLNKKDISAEDFQINYSDYQLHKAEYINLFNCDDAKDHTSILFNSTNSKNNNSLSSKENILMKRTFLNPEDLAALTPKKEFSSKADFHHQIRKKRQRTKFLLTKTRRQSDQSTKEGKENEFNDEQSSKEILNTCNDLFKHKFQKEIRKQKNREAAQKSRNNKKTEFEELSLRENILALENNELKKTLNEIKNMLNHTCENCRKLFNKFPEIRKTDQFGRGDKKVFKIIQKDNLTNVSNSPSRNKYTLLTGMFVILCIIANLFWINPTYNNSQSFKDKVNERILYSTTFDKNESNPINNLPKLPNIEELQKLPVVLIDDKQTNKSFYIKFFDYFKSKTGFSKNENTTNEIFKNNLKKTFLEKSEGEIDINNTSQERINNSNSCINNITVFKIPTKRSEIHSHKIDEDISNVTIRQKLFVDNRNSREVQKNDICNKTTLTGYFDLEFNQHVKKDDTCKNGDHNSFENLKNYIVIQENKKQDPLYFKMRIPLSEHETKAKIFEDNVESFIFNLLNQNLKDSSFEKSSKKFYYELECMVLDINQRQK